MASSSAKSKPQANGSASSRLLNMKFMQKPTITSSSPSKISSSPANSSNISNISRESIRKAKAEEEAKLEAALLNNTSTSEERWYLSYSDPNVSIRGGEIFGNVKVVEKGAILGDDDDSSSEDEQVANVGLGRRYFGGRQPPAPAEKVKVDSSSDSSDSDSEDSDLSESELEKRTLEKSAKKKAKKERLADKAVQKLKGGIGNASSRPTKDEAYLATVTCFTCGETGHLNRDCPNKPKRVDNYNRNKRQYDGPKQNGGNFKKRRF